MKKILLALTMISLFFVACSKQPFIEKKPENSAALVYVYVVADNGINDTNRMPCYTVLLGEEQMDGCMEVGDYMEFDVKPGKINFNISRANIEIQSVELNLAANETKYLRVQSYSDDFNKFKVVDRDQDVALKELSRTSLVGSYLKKDTGPSKLVIPKEEKKSFSKSDELEKAHALKEKGILSNEEFNKLKSEILAK